MAKKRSVIVRGCPIYDEQGVASATVKPGYLVDGITSIAHHATAGGNTARKFAVERDELGAGIDNTYQGSGTVSAYYASGDRVKVASCHAGMRVTAFVASGQNIAVNDKLESAGDGSLRKLNSGEAVAIATEAHSPNVVSGDAAIVVEIM